MADLPQGQGLLDGIERLRRELDAVILAHYYQDSEIQDLADFVGDSLQLSQQAAKTGAKVIVFWGFISWRRPRRSSTRTSRSCCRTWTPAARSPTAVRPISSRSGSKVIRTTRSSATSTAPPA